MKLIDKDAIVQYLTGMAESTCCDKNVKRIISEFIIPHINTLKVKEIIAEQEGICNGMFNRIIGDTWNLVIPFDKTGLKHGDKVKIFITKE